MVEQTQIIKKTSGFGYRQAYRERGAHDLTPFPWPMGPTGNDVNKL
jgi:hypothetical protein